VFDKVGSKVDVVILVELYNGVDDGFNPTSSVFVVLLLVGVLVGALVGLLVAVLVDV
jgi:hypothetical protein